MTPDNPVKLYVHQFLILLFFVILTYSTCHAISGNKNNGIEVQCVDKERDALLQFKRGILIDHCGLLDSWEGSLDCCQWSGIRCNSSTGHVTMLNLHGHGYQTDHLSKVVSCLEGTLSDSLVELKHLNYLDLSFNNFQGPMLKFIGSLANLKHLNLSNAGFYGRIPNEIRNFSTLSYLSVARNHLEGHITNTFSNLTQLTHLSLSGNNVQLSKQALKSLGNLCRLQTLQLADTNLTCEFSEVTNSLSPCAHKSLMSLSLSNTKVWGSVPDDISKFSSLELLYVEYNQLNGTISEGIGQLSRLQKLYLSSNLLNGVVSHRHFSNLSNLRVLDLSNNQALRLNLNPNWTPPFQLNKLKLGSCKVGPTFPKWLLTQQNLTDLDISGVGIIDFIPTYFWSSMSSTLCNLNMSNNMIHGTLPDLSSAFQQNIGIDMSSNQLSGAIPPFLRDNVSSLILKNNKLSQGLSRFLSPKTDIDIYVIDLSNNLFSETLPDCWLYFPSLSVLNLQNNKISGNLPSSIASINSLKALHLCNNSLSGELPKSWVNSTSLLVLHITYNSLTGSIPPSFGLSLVNLRVLSLRSNRFSMGIPSTLCQLKSLQILDLSSNQISRPLPKCLYNLTMMANKTNFRQPIEISVIYPLADFARFMWNRKEQSFDVLLGLLKAIDISDNNLQGQIPDEISSLTGLVFLNLSQNNLAGPIPSRIGQLASLNFLDLSRNHLSGEIPTSLALIDSLGLLDLSENNLSGKIPLGTQLQGFNASAYMDNPGLCGTPLPKCPGDQATLAPQNGDNIAQLKKHKNDDIFLGLVISVVLGVITGFWGVCGTLILKRSWRIALFQFYDDTRDKIYVMVVVNIIRPYTRSSN